MPVTTCFIEEMDRRLEYQKDPSDGTYSGLLHLESPVLFSFSGSLFIPPIRESHREAIKNAIKKHEETGARDPEE